MPPALRICSALRASAIEGRRAGRDLVQWSERVGTPARLIESFIGQRESDVWTDNTCQPVTQPWPERLLCDQLPGATNIRHGAAEALERLVAQPEDLRRRQQANARVNALIDWVTHRDQGKESSIPQAISGDTCRARSMLS